MTTMKNTNNKKDKNKEIIQIPTDQIEFQSTTLKLLESLFGEITERGGIFVFKKDDGKFIITEMYEVMNIHNQPTSNFQGVITQAEKRIIMQKAKLFNNYIGFWHTHPKGTIVMSKADTVFLQVAKNITETLFMIIGGDKLAIYQ